MPQFGLPADKQAVEAAKVLFPDTTNVPIECSELALKGGVLNCASWNIQV